MNMKKGVVLAVAAVLVVILMGAIIVFSGREELAPGMEPTVKNTVATTEVTIPGLEDSIFDDETVETTVETTEATDPTEETKETKPDATESTQAPEPDDPEPIETNPNESEPTTPKPTQPKPTEPEATQPTEGKSDSDEMDYETFQNMSPAEQQAFMESFGNIEAFFTWYNAAKEDYEKENVPIDVDGGTIDIGAIIAGKE